jgi:hypothetical protein
MSPAARFCDISGMQGVSRRHHAHWRAGSHIIVYFEACGLGENDVSVVAVGNQTVSFSVRKQTTQQLRQLGIASYVTVNPFYIADQNMVIDVKLPCEIDEAASQELQGRMLHGCYVVKLPKLCRL